MKKLLTVIAVVFGLSDALADRTISYIDHKKAEEVLLNGETIASGLRFNQQSEKFVVLMKLEGELFSCSVLNSHPIEDLTKAPSAYLDTQFSCHRVVDDVNSTSDRLRNF